MSLIVENGSVYRIKNLSNGGQIKKLVSRQYVVHLEHTDTNEVTATIKDYLGTLYSDFVGEIMFIVNDDPFSRVVSGGQAVLQYTFETDISYVIEGRATGCSTRSILVNEDVAVISRNDYIEAIGDDTLGVATDNIKMRAFWVKYCLIKLNRGMTKADLKTALLTKFTQTQVDQLARYVKSLL